MFQERRTWIRIIFVGCYSIIMLARAPILIVSGRLWAEEATVYFAAAVTQPWYKSLFAPHIGYFSLFSNVSALLATLVPLESAPLVLVCLAASIQLLPVLLVLPCREGSVSSYPEKVAVCLALLFILPNHEVWLSTISSQFYLAFSAGIILISNPASQFQIVFRRCVIGLAGLTGVVSIFLTPLFWFKFFSDKAKHRAVEAGILTVCAAIQGAIVLMTAPGQRTIGLHPIAFVHALLIKLFILPLAGYQIANRLAVGLYQQIVADGSPLDSTSLAVVLCGVLGYMVFVSRLQEARLLCVAAFLIATLSWIGAAESQTLENHALLISPICSERYFLCSSLFIYLALALIALRENDLPHKVRLGCGVLALWAVTAGAFDFRKTDGAYLVFFEGPAWIGEVEKYRSDPNYLLQVWPAGWEPLRLSGN